MDIARIKQLIDVVTDEQIAELNIIGREETVRIVRVHHEAVVPTAGHCVSSVEAGVAVAAIRDAIAVAPDPAPPARASGEVVAPMAGTFYGSASKDGEPFVKVGSAVEIGEPLCVIEAMKIMNGIEADRAGTVTRVLCESGQAVDRGQALFVIE